MSQVVTRINPLDLVRREFEEVERVLEEAAVSEIEVLQAGALHVLGAGGKRVRPQMVLLAALAAGGSLERAIPLAAACELVHTATLVHDDIVDESDRRRGRMAIQFSIGNSASVLMGDYLVVRSLKLVARDPNRELWTLLIDTIARMCEGEVLQICVKRDTDLSVDTYERIIEAKTAVLMMVCTRFGGMIADASPEIVEALGDFGYNVGMAFQVQDDILDFIGDEETLGKPTGGDLREGKVTLPVVYALQGATPEHREELLRIYEKIGPLSRDDIQRATQLIEISGGFERARQHALEFIDQALLDLRPLPDSAAKEALLALADRIVNRWN